MKIRFDFKMIKYFVLAVLVICLAVMNVPNVLAQSPQLSDDISKENYGTPVPDTSAIAFLDIQASNDNSSYFEVDTSVRATGVAALWVDGEKVAMTQQQVTEFEEKLYSCQTKEEYEALLETIAYYDDGIDMSRFPWYWEELIEIYGEEQVAMMRNGKGELKKVPNVVGMEVMKAFNILQDTGFIARISYEYNPNSNVAINHCFMQDPPGGSKWHTNSIVGIRIQASEELGGEVIERHPDDEDFDIGDEIQERQDANENYTPELYLIGLTEAQVIQKLSIDNYKIKIKYSFWGKESPDGVCVSFYTMVESNDLEPETFYITINDYSLEEGYVSIFVGRPLGECINTLESHGLRYRIVYEYDGSDTPAGTCTWQEYPCNSSILLTTSITLKIQSENPTPEPTPEPTSEPTPELTDPPTDPSGE